MNQHDVNFVADFLRDNFAQFTPVSVIDRQICFGFGWYT